MSQNPQTNIQTEDDPFFNNGPDSNGPQQVIQLDQSFSNILYNDNIIMTSDNSLPKLYGTTPMTCVDSTSKGYLTMSYGNNVGTKTDQVSTQNFSQSAMNSLPPYMATPSEIITFEIPGYDVIYIPKPYPFINSNVNLNMQQHDINFLNASPFEQQSYVSSVSGISVGERSNVINTHDNHVTLQNQQQNFQELNNLHDY